MTAVLMFAKAPRAGLVKTRLAREIGEERALEAYRRCGRRVADQVRAGYRLTIWYAPVDALEELRAWLGEVEYRAQDAGDLGDRLRGAFAAHFARGDGPVIAIGADAPGVDASTIRAAEQALNGSDVVLGPALDGGYYLIGLRRPTAPLFERVPWSTPDVLQVTLKTCEERHLAVSLLEPLRDLDTAADLEALSLERT